MSSLETFVKRVNEYSDSELIAYLKSLASDFSLLLKNDKIDVAINLDRNSPLYEFYLFKGGDDLDTYKQCSLFWVEEQTLKDINNPAYTFLNSGDGTPPVKNLSFEGLKKHISNEFETNMEWVKLVKSLLVINVD